MREQLFFHFLSTLVWLLFRARILRLLIITYYVISLCEIPLAGPHRKAGLSMTGQELRESRRKKRWTQEETAEKLGVTQAYLSMLESGRRSMPYQLARLAVEALSAPPTALPLRAQVFEPPMESEKLGLQLTALGYPGFAHLPSKTRRNPAEVLLTALHATNLETRVTEGLPWLALAYADMDWDWVVQNAKLHDKQNRLGFVVTLASQLASKSADSHRAGRLREYMGVLERSRLVKEDTLCQDSLTEAERKWLRANRPAEAAHWNLLTDMKAENLPHATL
jgi:transcriptional regulator with XRE-family HTH domain